MTSLEFRRDLWQQKTKVPWLLYGVVCMIRSLAVLVQYWHVTDAQTDRPTTTAYTALRYASTVKINAKKQSKFQCNPIDDNEMETYRHAIKCRKTIKKNKVV